ncbi:MAG: NAD(P)-dependent oxidoreductase [Candidatus Omnitrophica bacterium]|nr:NAD(P)-dependent oxidoreductase [Candidatus Omnitrophota bacterium]MCK6495914.1 NAD(P)-dependent oxidoreductase [bacterium]NUP93360.1 NAD(P)-dependent oxidoreductase [Candidatus Omnitrophota bacterium]
MMKILVTGSSGRTGPSVVNSLARHYEIRGMDLRRAPGLQCADFYYGDITDMLDVQRAIEGVEAVVHLGARSGNSRMDPENVIRTNVTGTYHILEAAREAGVTRVVLISSECALGYAQGRFRPKGQFPLHYLPIDENHPDSPTSEYGLSKLLGERLCRGYTEGCGMQTFCLRPSSILLPEDYSHFARIYQDPEAWDNMWSVVDVRDVAAAIHLCLDNRTLMHEVFYINSGLMAVETPASEIIRRFFPDITELPEGLDDRKSLISIEKACRLLGYTPRYLWQGESDGPGEPG